MIQYVSCDSAPIPLRSDRVQHARCKRNDYTGKLSRYYNSWPLQAWRFTWCGTVLLNNVCPFLSRLPSPLLRMGGVTLKGIVVQLVGSKTWMLYDEMLPAPRADLKYKPAAADLGEPIAVLQLNPGDLMYIPRRAWRNILQIERTSERGKRRRAR